MEHAPHGQTAEYLTPRQVSCLLQIPTTTLAIWRSTGRVQLAYVKVGRAVRYLRADVDDLIATGRRGHDAL